MWGEIPWIFLPLPLLLFLAKLVAQDKAQVEALSLLGLGVAACEEVGLTKGPLFLKIEG